ncbi:MAG: hypothetical protein IJM44_00060 [Ruminococcus sp.]|nr:hypothetical protein [Ruminococcus sp.]
MTGNTLLSADPDSYELTEQEKARGDVTGNGDGVTNLDALMIQKYEAGLADELHAG